ncbi:ATP-binding cassette domain-containing protein [Azohydromonas lata]|uniref:ATP-binding cassette domain-containing protein n=1 Tax=Azohydromonas lata TaxID=45677 RepID=A0ABU5ILR2_9BURK|nr:ATP-binding cassette domain-containing protein [Azohydromonas lata]MDZ5459819.1 ATP-binding cassette domain-containing protein [Azohydromonas lata]
MSAGAPAVQARGLCKSFEDRAARRTVHALSGVTLDVAHGAITALVGPDGAGKTTFMRLVAGLMRAQAGELRVLGLDVAADAQAVQDRISYMPQRFGLYEDLSVQENLDLYADLHAVPREERRRRFDELLHMTDLARFTTRPAGKLSGGMKQKLGLACTLVRSPELLLLDEPTVGVDPLSRRELWDIVQRLVERERLSVLLATSYMDEAERCSQVHVLHEGRLLAAGSPEALRAPAQGLCAVATPAAGEPARTLQARLLDRADRVVDAVPQGGEVRLIHRPGVDAAALGLSPDQLRPVPPRLEDGFMRLLRERGDGQAEANAVEIETSASPAPPRGDGQPAIEVQDLVRRFGDFVAVDRTTFSVRHGEIFGLLGPNGAGKTTTFRMLCGLLPASSGLARVAGLDLRRARAAARQRIGYVAQKFSLYANLSVHENLRFFGGAYGLHGRRLPQRMDAVLGQFQLRGLEAQPAGQLPGGVRQRLAMAVGLLHEPEILFLDEPTSGADPLARRGFWRRITALAATGITVVVTTHFMEEAEYCDRIVIQDGGRLLALGTPAEVRRQAGETPARRLDMEQAFISIVENARALKEAA